MAKTYFKDFETNLFAVINCPGWHISADSIEDALALANKRGDYKITDLKQIGSCVTIIGKSNNYEDVINMRDKLERAWELLSNENSDLHLQNVIRRHFVDDSSCVAFINALDELLSRMDFDSRRKIKSAESTTASIVLRLKKFKKLPENEGYYLGINKISRVILD